MKNPRTTPTQIKKRIARLQKIQAYFEAQLQYSKTCNAIMRAGKPKIKIRTIVKYQLSEEQKQCINALINSLAWIRQSAKEDSVDSKNLDQWRDGMFRSAEHAIKRLYNLLEGSI